MDNTKALNLWDIESRIKKLHEELEILHQQKAELLGEEYHDLLEFTKGT